MIKFCLYSTIILAVIFLSSCSSVPQCGTQTFKFQFPNAIPFLGDEPFVIKRENDHVSCHEGKSDTERLLDEILDG